MRFFSEDSLSLIELIIAVSLLLFCTLAVTNLDIFSRYQVITSDKRIKVQNELSYALEHMQLQISRAIGNSTLDSIVDTSAISGDLGVKVYIDAGKWDGTIQDYLPGDGVRATDNDHWIGYRFTGATGNSPYQLWYYHFCANANCAGNSSPATVIAKNITSFIVSGLIDNYINVALTGRWDATQNVSVDNPEITMRIRIYLPAVSTH
ncbi:MAG: hypothetical protein NC912_05775 [Candidatus Omnitrophica bacterium]|nr:hypothetical protein [Candidatus Omnitrophota bacterium]